MIRFSKVPAAHVVVSVSHVFKDKEFILNSYIVQGYINQFYDFEQIYTDAAKNIGNQVGVAFNFPELKIKVGKRLNNGLSVCTGEMLALLLAVQWVEDNKPLWTIICSL